MDHFLSRKIPGGFFTAPLFFSSVVSIPVVPCPFFGTEIVEVKSLKAGAGARYRLSFPSVERSDLQSNPKTGGGDPVDDIRGSNLYCGGH